MARVTVEDCIQYVQNRFELVIVAAQRSKELNYGTLPVSSDVTTKRNQEAVLALREIATGKLNIEMLKNSIVKESITENDNIDMQKESIDEIEQAVVENVEFLKKDISSMSQKKQIYQDEEIIEG